MTAKTCPTCKHQIEDRYVKCGFCAHPGAYKPNGELPACVVVSARVIDGYYAKHGKSIDHCPHWEAK